jgi:hypothetical protein
MDLCTAFCSIDDGVARWLHRARKHPSPMRSVNQAASAIRLTPAAVEFQVGTSVSANQRAGSFRLHEVTLTDYVVLRLMELCSPWVKVVTFTLRSERLTGADLELWITDRSRRWIGLRVQCKAQDEQGSIPGLGYALGGARQSSQLINAAGAVPGCVPVYLVFALAPRGMALSFCPCLARPSPRQRRGAWWVSASNVDRLRPSRPVPLQSLRPLMPFPCLVCCWYPDHLAQHAVESVQWALRLTGLAGDSLTPVDEPPPHVQRARERGPADIDTTLEERPVRHLVILDLTESS